MKLNKEIGLLEATAITVGSIIGSGIFVTPGGILEIAGSVGFSLSIWVFCGVISTLGALCYSELGATFPTSGSDYYYLQNVGGPLFGFLFLWISVVIIMPTTHCVLALTFAQYVIQPFFNEGCDLPWYAVRLLAGSAITLLTFVNCFDVRITTKLQNVLMVCKICSLVLVIGVGMSAFFLNNSSSNSFRNPWDNMATSPSSMILSVYYGMWSYSGYNSLNYLTEELKDPTKNLPRAVILSMMLITVIYLGTNVAYLAVLSPQEMIASHAVAVTLFQKQFPAFAWVIPLLVGISTFGCLSIYIMMSSRLLFVGAREGHSPKMLATININRRTPIPSLIFLSAFTLLYLVSSDVLALIELQTFVYSLCQLTTVGTLVYLRWKQPNLERPFKVHILIPLAFTLICVAMVILPVYERPVEAAIGFSILLTGLPVYWIFVRAEKTPRWLNSRIDRLGSFVQMLLLAAKDE